VAESTELELVILARQGDKDAFGRLIERYQGMMNRIAMRVLGSSEAAQDMVQEAMFQAYLCLKDLRDEASFRSWLYGIVLNVCKSYIRDQGRGFRFNEALNDDQPEGVWNTGGASQDPQQIFLERELHRRVLSAIQEPPSSPPGRTHVLL
jgi:RNA polymerase sigma factor (sigma-70 family)